MARHMAKFCSDMIPYVGFTLNPIFIQICIMMEKSFMKWATWLVLYLFLSKVSSNETCYMNLWFLLNVQNECCLSLVCCLPLKWHHMNGKVSRVTGNFPVCSWAVQANNKEISKFFIKGPLFPHLHRECFPVIASSWNFMQSLFWQIKIWLNTATCVFSITIVVVYI